MATASILQREVNVEPWEKYQNDVAEFFRRLGLRAHTDQTVIGSRTAHQIDVLVKGYLAGIEILWAVECKAWASRIPKEKVLAFRQVVVDIGADRGFLIAEAGFQAGALEASRSSNVTLTSICELESDLSYELAMRRLQTLESRVDRAHQRLRNLSKETRIEAGLRPSIDGGSAYSALSVIETVGDALKEVRLRGFPVRCNNPNGPFGFNPAQPATIDDPATLFGRLDEFISELELRLEAAESE